jgi:hypothetical protein
LASIAALTLEHGPFRMRTGFDQTAPRDAGVAEERSLGAGVPSGTALVAEAAGVAVGAVTAALDAGDGTMLLGVDVAQAAATTAMTVMVTARFGIIRRRIGVIGRSPSARPR